MNRLTIQEAARSLGVSEGAVRKRVTRGTLEHEKDPSGRVWVYLQESGTRGRQGVDDVQDAGVDPHSGALISELRDQVAYLRDENRRKDEIIMQQAMTMRELTPPQEGPQEASEDAGGVADRGESAEPHSGAQRPWWRRWFSRGGE